MDYVTHTCKQCGCAFVAEDYTNCQDIPPHWRYCPECAKSLSIEYEKQKTWTNRTKEQKKRISEQIGRLKEFRFKSKTKH